MVNRPALLVALLALLPGAEAQEAKTSTLRGKVTLGIEGISLEQAGPLVVYLEAREGKVPFDVPREVPVMSQKDARFSPPFMAITAGQTVSLANDDRIVHNVFSYSPPKKFDLGLYPKGEYRSVTFDLPGVVDLFCSIHAKMNATIFVAPTPYFAVVGAGGGYEIPGVPPGKYHLRCWSRKLPAIERELDVSRDVTIEADLVFRGSR